MMLRMRGRAFGFERTAREPPSAQVRRGGGDVEKGGDVGAAQPDPNHT